MQCNVIGNRTKTSCPINQFDTEYYEHTNVLQKSTITIKCNKECVLYCCVNGSQPPIQTPFSILEQPLVLKLIDKKLFEYAKVRTSTMHVSEEEHL